MRRLLFFVALAIFSFSALPTNSPAALVWRKGEGWSFEGSETLIGKNPTEQLEIAKKWLAAKKYGNALGAYRRLLSKWPTSFAAEEGRMGLGECLSATGYHYKAFLQYKALLEKTPNSVHFETALQREFEIGNLFLGGTKHKILGMQFFPSQDKAVEVFTQIVKTGPYSKVGAQAQMRLGMVYEKQADYISAVHAYEKVIERYPDTKNAETAQFKIGTAYKQEALRAEYDQNTANQAITAFSDYLTKHPKGEFVADATKSLSTLKLAQAQGLYRIGEFYEKQQKTKSALIYYNEVIEKTPRSTWAELAQKKVAFLTPASTPTPTAEPAAP